MNFKLQLTRPLVFFDLETTGTDKQKDHICQISTIKLFPDKVDAERKQMLVKPPIPIPAAATAIHSISDETVANVPTFAQIAKALLEYLKGCDFGGYNILQYDVALLFNEFARAGLKWEYNESVFVDACSIYKQKEARTLEAAYKFYLKKNLEGAHDATIDNTAAMDVFFEQLGFYEDLQAMQCISDVAKFCNGFELLDVNGNFKRNEEGKIVFNIGQHRGKLATSERSYLDWIINKSTFDSSTKEVAQKILYSQLS